jgi:hypothetical protein
MENEPPTPKLLQEIIQHKEQERKYWDKIMKKEEKKPE